MALTCDTVLNSISCFLCCGIHVSRTNIVQQIFYSCSTDPEDWGGVGRRDWIWPCY